MRRLIVFAVLLFALPAHAEVTMDWVTVGDPGNACEVQPPTGDVPGGCFGAVAYEYRIGKYEVTNAQYTEFLNAVAATDPWGLYNTMMGAYWGGITRSGSPGSYTYSVIAGRENMPVNHVSPYDAMRFANWMHNGQPPGAQDDSTTEDGAYDISVWPQSRKAGAKVFLTSEDEWYKAAYYKGGGTSAGYWDYPAGSDTQTTCALPGATANTANCDFVVDPPSGDLTDVGSYTGSASPYGTFDQGGNVSEWNEATIGTSRRGRRGGDWHYYPTALAASYRAGTVPTWEETVVGFRVASRGPLVPSLSPKGVALLGGLVFGMGIVGLVIAARRRLK